MLEEVRDWQSRALEHMPPIVIFDALRVKIRDADSRMVKNKAQNRQPHRLGCEGAMRPARGDGNNDMPI